MTKAEQIAVKTLLEAMEAAGIANPAEWINAQREALKSGAVGG